MSRPDPLNEESALIAVPVLLRSEVRHSAKEERHYILGQTGVGRELLVAFAVRGSLTQYLDWSQAKRVKFLNLKPSLKTISLRLPTWMFEDLKIRVNRRDVPCQSLLKVFLAGRIARERRM